MLRLFPLMFFDKFVAAISTIPIRDKFLWTTFVFTLFRPKNVEKKPQNRRTKFTTKIVDSEKCRGDLKSGEWQPGKLMTIICITQTQSKVFRPTQKLIHIFKMILHMPSFYLFAWVGNLFLSQQSSLGHYTIFIGLITCLVTQNYAHMKFLDETFSRKVGIRLVPCNIKIYIYIYITMSYSQ